MLIRINLWSNYTLDSTAYLLLDFTSCDLFWGFRPMCLELVWPFLGFRIKCLPKIWFESTHDSSNISESLNRFDSWLKRLSRELTQNQLTTQKDPQVLIQIDLWFKRLSREFIQNHLMTQADPRVLIQISSRIVRKNNWFWVDSWFDSGSYPCLIYTLLIAVARIIVNWSNNTPYFSRMLSSSCSRDAEKGYAPAHVQMYPTTGLC